MKAFYAVIALGLACVFVSQTYAKEKPTDCLPISDPKCKNSKNTADMNGVKKCCPESKSMSVSSTNDNGNTTTTCTCGGTIHMPKMHMPEFHMPKMPRFHWPSHFPFNY